MIVAVDDSALQEMLDLAKRLATEAARIAVPQMGHATVARKSDASLVTDADRAIQEHIFQAIQRTYPDHALLGEETAPDARVLPAPAQSRYCWVVDPLDGTRNYVARIPIYATSIAVLDRGRPCVAVVTELNLEHVYAAVCGRGATLNGQPIRVAGPRPGDDYMVGIPSSKDQLTVDVVRAWAPVRELICRNLGSTALHLAMVASGSMGAAFSKRCKIWDIAAGWLLVKEAGGCITGIHGEELSPFSLDAEPDTDIPFLAGAPEVHEHLLGSFRTP